jgi:hypothetical protein
MHWCGAQTVTIRGIEESNTSMTRRRKKRHTVRERTRDFALSREGPMAENGSLLGLTGPAGREGSTSAETPQALGGKHRDRGFG